MKRALIFVLAALLLSAAAGEALGQKKNKVKEKRFEPTTRARLTDYEGRYVGIDASYFLDIVVASGDTLHITSHEGERAAQLKDVRLAGSVLTATKVYGDGATEKFHATFVNRILNGVSAFGLLVDGMHVELEDMTLTSIFYTFKADDLSRAHAFIEREAALARKEIEARYAELSEAVRNRDFVAYQALRTENFSARLADGEVRDGTQMARRARALFGRIAAPISLSNQIELLILMDNEAIAIVHQKFSRTQQLAGELHLVETSTTQRETWIRTVDGWKLKFVDNIHAQQTLVDGLPVEGASISVG